MKKIDYTTAQNIITKYDLKILEKIWHYSFNKSIRHDKFFELIRNGEKIIISEPLNEHCPPLIYGGSIVSNIKVNNSLTNKYQKAIKTQRKIFWHLKLTNFDDFLKRRTEMSSKPRKHFPTIYTYKKINEKLSINLTVEDYCPENFNLIFDQIKLDNHITGHEIVKNLISGLSCLPMKWLKTVKLICDDEVMAIALLIDDNKSISLENITSVRSKYSYGVILCLELIKKYSLANYYSFDAGISNIYGVYKDKIFLDSFEVYQRPKSIAFRLINKLKRLIKK